MMLLQTRTAHSDTILAQNKHQITHFLKQKTRSQSHRQHTTGGFKLWTKHCQEGSKVTSLGTLWCRRRAGGSRGVGCRLHRKQLLIGCSSSWCRWSGSQETAAQTHLIKRLQAGDKSDTDSKGSHTSRDIRSIKESDNQTYCCCLFFLFVFFLGGVASNWTSIVNLENMHQY